MGKTAGSALAVQAFSRNKVIDESEVQIENNLVIPSFSKEWNEEYLIAVFQPLAFRAVAWLVFVFVGCTVAIILADGQDGYNGTRSVFYWTWAPYILCCAIYLFLAVLFSLNRCRPICIRHYNAFCAVSIILLYLACVSTYVILELRAARYGSADFPQIVRTINYSSFPPTRSCADLDPERTWATSPRVLAFSGGSCCNFVLSGASFSLYTLLNVLPMVGPARSAGSARMHLRCRSRL